MSTIVDTLVGLAILAAFLVVAAIGFIAAYFTPVILANAIRVQIDKLDWQIRRTHSKILIRVWYARWLIISLVTTALVAVYLMHIPSDRLTDTVLDIISRTPYGLILDLYRRIAGVSTTTNWFSQMFYIAIIWLLSNRLSARYNATNLFGDRMETEIVSDNSFNRRRLLRTFIYGTPLLVALSVAADWLNTHFPISLDFVKSAYKLFNENREDFKGILYCTVFAFLIGVAAAIILAVITGFLRRIIDGITGFLLVIAMGVALIVPAIVIDALGIADNAVVVITVLAAIVLIGNALLIEYQTMKESGESSSGPQFGVRGVYIKPSGYDIVTWLDSTPDSDNCKFIYKNGRVYRGQWSNEQPNGIGEMVYTASRPDFSNEENNWLLWEPEKADIKSIYIGDWKNGKRHGHGKEIFSDGTVIESVWQYDKRCGS